MCMRRYTSIEVLFDILKYHGSSFNSGFWMRVFDSVLLPIFDHVRAEVRLRALKSQYTVHCNQFVFLGGSFDGPLWPCAVV